MKIKSKIIAIVVAIIMVAAFAGFAAAETTRCSAAEIAEETTTEAQTEPQTEEATEDITEVPTDEATEPTTEAHSETVKAERITENPAEAPTEEPTEETDDYPDVPDDKGVGVYNPYMYCPVAPVSNHRIGIGYIDEGRYLFDEIGHCWKIDNPDDYSDAVSIVYNTCGTDDITDDVLVLIMVDYPVWIEAIG